MNVVSNDFPAQFNELNSNLQYVGKYKRQGLFWSKTFVSFDQKGQLKIQDLNLFQIFARKFFGCYPDTTLKNVIRSWNDYQIKHGDVCPKLSEKLTSLWMKKYSEKISFHKSETFSVGNISIKDAEVIAIGHLFSDPHNTQFCCNLISANYKHGDVILVEGVDANKIFSSEQCPLTNLLINPANVNGWEPIGFEALHAKVFESTINIETHFTYNANLAIKLLKNVNFFTTPSKFKFSIVKKHDDGSQINKDEAEIEWNSLLVQEKEQLWKEIFSNAMKNFLESVGKIDERLYKPNVSMEDEFTKVAVNQVETLIKELEKFILSQKNRDDCAYVIEEIIKTFKIYYQAFQKDKYRSKWTTLQDNFFVNTWGIRQHSLSNEIDRYRELGKRVFVCAGAAHFFPNKGKNDSEVIRTLKKYKFTISLSNIKENATYYSFHEIRNKYLNVNNKTSN